MNAKIKLMNIKTKCGEKVGDIVVKRSTLKSINCPASLVPSTIDEFTILMIAAAKAKGITTFSGLGFRVYGQKICVLWFTDQKCAF